MWAQAVPLRSSVLFTQHQIAQTKRIQVKSRYYVDGAYPVTYEAPWPAISSPIAQLFSSTRLSAGSHQLFVRVTTVAKDRPYYLDHIRINNTMLSTLPSPSSIGTPPEHKSPNIPAIIGGTVGGFALLVVFGLIFVLLRRRRRRSYKADMIEDDEGYAPLTHNPVTPFFQRRTANPPPSKLGHSITTSAGSTSTIAIVDSDGGIRLETGQIIRPEDIPPAY
ncbi:hypothetical protein B0H19DRAFT_1070051 [Mycena capillaripes]|nr:hypothetical protein B0H19DRAFT_1070051 [Mycena capillaripes]